MKRYARIAKTLHVGSKEILPAIERIRRLDPKPGRDFSTAPSVAVIPDVSIKRIRRGRYQVECDKKHMPELHVSSFYKRLLQNKNTPAETRAYLREKLESALSLLRAIGQREKTIERLARCIAERQTGFLEKGPRYLKPHTLEQAAKKLSLHKSTISRAAANKYLETPQGIFTFKWFFSRSIPSDRGEDSSQSVQNRIKTLIQDEDPNRPLSDGRLAGVLKSQGVYVARRTVAKYRAKIRILPSFLRKAPQSQ